ncbi:MAG TPA: SDR family oxidoreductase [Thermoanaerobaculia bacterium]|nr:SDR family oxidoreductase [Thermoanaerobaculia bacterium]
MRTLIITGGTGGLGEVVVPRTARDHRCVVLYRTERPEGANVEAVRSDLTNESSVRAALEEAVQRFGAPYGLVHLAGGYAGGNVSQTSGETWRQMMGLNADSSFFVIRHVLAHMRRDEPGRIIAISSAATRTKLAGAAAYTVSKSALNVLIELTAAELEGSGITANAILPDSLDTPATRKAMPEARLVPLDRVAETILFLLSDAAASINGALIPLEG